MEATKMQHFQDGITNQYFDVIKSIVSEACYKYVTFEKVKRLT